MDFLKSSSYEEQRMLQRYNEVISGRYNIYLLGTNEWANDIIDKFTVHGVIDEFSRNSTFKGLPLINDLKKINPLTDIVISCILGRPWTVKQKMDSLGIKNIDYFAFWKCCNLNLIDNRNWNQFKTNFSKEKYEELSKNLNDLESRRTLHNIVNFRLTQNIDFMKFHPDRQFYQYFEPFLNLSNEIFLDIGGFDGSSSIQFCNYCINPLRILFFEPDGKNMSVAQKRLANAGCEVDFFQIGLGEKKQELRFSQNGSTSRVDEKGTEVINIDAIDNILEKYPTNGKYYIKMDIEGWELSALKGGLSTIKDKMPKMAICVYHKSNDLLDIFHFVKSIHPSYLVFLRHYTEGVDETVMYFIPPITEA